MRRQALGKFDGITGGKMRPFRTLEASEFGKIFEVDAWSAGLLQKRFPDFRAGRGLIFELLQTTADGQSNEHNFAAARA